ncbi:Alanine--glyoxylate aminotransferase 2-like protein 1 [Diplonema papillatum]|nr:Alanine--glyoxylate aminotransferase 2-like protein 1 [Diplonema papillatum]|eukprot:gene22370-34252_t
MKAARRLLAPAVLGGAEYTPAPYAGADAAAISARRKRYTHPVRPVIYGDKPFALVEGKMQFVWDDQGSRHLDMFGGIVTTSVGHCHPRLVEAAAAQLKTLWHVSDLYLNDNYNALAEYLTRKAPAGHDWVVYLTNSGGESTEFAMLQARVHTKHLDYITLRNSYHGIGSSGARMATSSKGWNWRVPGDPNVKHALCPNLYSGVFRGEGAVDKYLDDLRTVIAESCSTVAGIGIEPFQGVGGVVEMPAGYLRRAHAVVRENGGVCVSDEVQTGFGRLGDCYWGFEKDADGVCPDVIVCAKSIGNGWPLGAVLVKKAVAESMQGAGFFNTFAGNPVAAAVGLETLKVMDEEGLQNACKRLGDILLAGLRDLQQRFPVIGDIRGRGLMIGIELVQPGTTTPAPQETTALVRLMRDRSVLIGKGGPAGNVVRLKPPMCITEADCAYCLEQFEACLQEITAG